MSGTEDHRVDVRRCGHDWMVLFVTGDTAFSGVTGCLFSSSGQRPLPPGEALHGRKYLEARERKAPRWFRVHSPDGWD